MKKIDLFLEIKDIIMLELNNFWSLKENKKSFKTYIDKKLTFDSDNLLLLFTYVILKVNISELYTDFSILNDLLPEYMKINIKGYILSLIRSSIEVITKFLNKNHFNNNRIEYINQFELEINSIKKLM